MMNLSALQLALQPIRKWIEKTLDENISNAVSVASLSFPRLSKIFPDDLLERAKVVITGNIPIPPLSDLGLPDFIQMGNNIPLGVTYKDTFFINNLNQKNESIYFHELIHIVQWERLGIDNFLVAYCVGLLKFGYQNSPLEKMAHSLQTDFDRGILIPNIVENIQNQTDKINIL